MIKDFNIFATRILLGDSARIFNVTSVNIAVAKKDFITPKFLPSNLISKANNRLIGRAIIVTRASNFRMNNPALRDRPGSTSMGEEQAIESVNHQTSSDSDKDAEYQIN